MNTINNNNNNLSFQAKFKINDELKMLNKERWANIGKIIEQKTAKQPNDVVEIGTAVADKPIYLYIASGDEESCSTITQKGLKKLLTYNDDTIAQKFLKLFKVQSKNNKIYTKTINFIDYISNNSKKALETKTLANDFDDGIMKSVNNATSANEKEVINKDSFLRNTDYFEFRDEF